MKEQPKCEGCGYQPRGVLSGDPPLIRENVGVVKGRQKKGRLLCPSCRDKARGKR